VIVGNMIPVIGGNDATTAHGAIIPDLTGSFCAERFDRN